MDRERKIDVNRAYGYKDGSAIPNILKKLENHRATNPGIAAQLSHLEREIETPLASFNRFPFPPFFSKSKNPETMTMFSKILLLSTFLSFTFIIRANGADTKGENWVSPDKTRTLHLVANDIAPHNPPVISLVAEVHGTAVPIVEPAIITSPFIREYAGTSWLWDTVPRWSVNRFAIFEANNDSGIAQLAIIDVEKGIMLLNTTFEALADGPGDNQWAALRYRPTTRNQERLNGSEKDTLFIINLPDVVSAFDAKADRKNKLFGHLESTLLPGVALARPLWKGNGNDNRVLVGIWDWTKRQAQVLSFDPKSWPLHRSAIMNLEAPQSVIFSPSIDREFEPKVLQTIAHSGL